MGLFAICRLVLATVAFSVSQNGVFLSLLPPASR